VKTIRTSTKDHLGLLTWAEQIARSAGDGSSLLWAIEDCRHLSRHLERDLLAAGQSIVRVPPKLMARVRDSARTYGKSDPIDALAVARAAQREPDCSSVFDLLAVRHESAYWALPLETIAGKEESRPPIGAFL
jgi:transposase